MDTKRIFIPTSDSFQYEAIAKNLLENKVFSLEQEIPLQPDTIRTPGYPVFIAFFYRLFGHKPFVIILIQIILTSLLIPLIYSLPFMNNQEKGIASLLYILNLNIALHTAQLITESIFMTLLFIAVVSLLSYLRTPTVRRLIQSSLLFALGTLIRPIGLYFPFIIIIFIVAKMGLKKGIISSIILILSFFIFISPWYVRNYVTFKRVFFSSIISRDLLYYEAAVTMASEKGISVEEAQDNLSEKLEDEMMNMGLQNEMDKLGLMSRLGFRYLFRHPIDYAKVRLIGFANCIFLPIPPRAMLIYLKGKSIEDMGLKGHLNQEVINLISQRRVKEALVLIFKERITKLSFQGVMLLGFSTLYHLLLLFGVGISLRAGWLKIEFKWLFIATILYFTFIPGTMGHPRFRTPVEPYLVLLSVSGWFRNRR